MNRRTTAVVFLAAFAGLYETSIRQRLHTWGATGEEADTRLAGDELLAHADGISTRAIEIEAPLSAVWPWIAQMGPAPRGGAYTYDWIENLLGLDMHSVDHVLPEFQHPEIGDTISLGANRMSLKRIDPEQCLAWGSDDGDWVWSFALRPTEHGTRLISRNRFRTPTLAGRLGMLPMEPASLVMERRMLLGIKRRAEALASASTTTSSVAITSVSVDPMSRTSADHRRCSQPAAPPALAHQPGQRDPGLAEPRPSCVSVSYPIAVPNRLPTP